jgi:hypothetical protein
MKEDEKRWRRQEVRSRTTLGLDVRTGNTYMYSVRDPLSDKERYMREAPMDLYSPCQKHSTLGRDDSERTDRMATTAGAGKGNSVRVAVSMKVAHISYLLARRASDVKITISLRTEEII